MESLFGKIILGWVRHGVGMFGGALVAHGYLTGAQADQMTGALMVLVPLAASALDKWEAEQAKNQAILKAANLAASTSEK